MKLHLPLDKRLFLYISMMIVVFAGCFFIYQHQRDKEQQIILLRRRLYDYNNYIHKIRSLYPDMPLSGDLAIDYIIRRGLRITCIDLKGKVFFDSRSTSEYVGQDESKCPEVKQALETGEGYALRTSLTSGIETFYVANCFPQYIIRTSLPWNFDVQEMKQRDNTVFWTVLSLELALMILAFRLTYNIGKSIRNLKDFTNRLEDDEPLPFKIIELAPTDELGEISQHIIRIYQHLRDTTEALNIERDKLMAHLYTARQGLGIFSRAGKEILINNLFIQYSNVISDTHLNSGEQVLQIKDLQPITDFIRDSQFMVGLPERHHSIILEKNGRFFTVECIIFQDLSYEISINDVTQEEEQSQIKRELTQNIAHELKTPVSSIQGYLETILTSEKMDSEQMFTFLKRCYEQSTRLTHLLRDISTLTRMDEASSLFEMDLVSVYQLVVGIIEEVQLQLDEKHITMKNMLNQGIVLRGNQLLLYSIFRNLIDNSIAYAGSNIDIIIQCIREDQQFYYFSYADTGVGVSTEHLQRLFNRFYRVDKGRSRKLGGTGLGLAIVRNATIIHGGNIYVKPYQGGGLEFIFTLSKGL